MRVGEIKRVALVTGANKGIGFAAARLIGKLGIKVLIGSRETTRGEEAVRTLLSEGIDARGVKIDVTDVASIADASAGVESQEHRLDILVNNAAIGLARQPPSELDTIALRETLATNLFGTVAVTRAFLPLLRRSDTGRIVNVSSALGSTFHLSDPEWVGYSVLSSTYSISKAALNAFTAILAAELQGSTIKVNAVDPGFTKTDLTSQQGFQTPDDAARVIVKYSTVGADGPTGGFFDIKGRIPW
jgi:NAD(P)-dependent dehydrogenase (short-subunit alcohol dehydrogenase family)